MNGTTTEYKALRDRIRLSFVELTASCEIDAYFDEMDARLLESARSRLSESRELLARVDTLLSTRSVRRRPQRDILRKAMERVFDKWIDQKASPLQRSNLVH